MNIYAELLPYVLYHIQNRDWEKAFFDLYTKSYIPLDEGCNMIEKALQNQKIDPAKIEVYHNICTMGRPATRWFPSDEELVLEYVESPVPRPDGKAICNYLRDLRLQLAAANNIPFSSEECPSVGPCAGTCAKCDSEAEYLFEKMQEIPIDNRIYPDNLLDRWEGLM